MMEQVCAGVAAIHAAETVHRDIKPSNILVGADDHPWVADLGLAIFQHLADVAGRQIVGTPAYMAPEVAFPADSDNALGERADVYSLACIAYELVTGYPPFAANGSMAMMLAHATATVTPPSTRRPGLPGLLDEAILHALARRPFDRTPTVAAFGAALQAARAGVTKPARILVVDDDPDFRQLLKSGLEAAFPAADLECVGDGHAALAAFDRDRPSVAILDLRMPGLDGHELTQRLRARDPAATMPIIVVTGSGGPKEWTRLSAMGVDRLLVKPVALDDVVALVHRLITERSNSSAARRLDSQLPSRTPA
jgi:CheY-like chemotaxis protein